MRHDNGKEIHFLRSHGRLPEAHCECGHIDMDGRYAMRKLTDFLFEHGIRA